MNDLVEFLLARIAEEEMAARAAMGAPSYPHYGDTAAEETLEMAFAEGCAPEGPEYYGRWSPERVLAECEAKRRIVDNHGQRFQVNGELHDAQTLRWFAMPYAGHPGYREEWKP